MADLQNKKIAFLVANEGVEQVELTEPWKAVEQAGAQPELVSLEEGQVQAFSHLDKADTFEVDRTVADADPSDYDGLVLPGGVANPDFLRMDERAVTFARSFFESGKPVGVICHGPWTLVDEEVVVDEGLISSRRPDDLPAFCAKIVEEFAEGRHEGQRARTLGAQA
jgi:protease I